tara:strand:- start:12833 stop:13555 length:723 start_codon:yes stop_codon:yes gene_type:complete
MYILKRNLPNLITLANLLCGLLSIIFAFKGSLDLASLCIFLGAFFDLFDGLLARILNVTGQLGKQLDSMADLVTFGVAPGFIMFNFMFYLNNNILFCHSISNQGILLPLSLALLIPILSSYRLANFNIDNKQTTSFIGLPTPALGIFFAAIPQIDFKQFPMFIDMQFLTIICIIMPILLLVKIPLFSFKVNYNEDINSRLNILRVTLILSTVILFFAFQFAAIPFIVILYLILSLLNNIL